MPISTLDLIDVRIKGIDIYLLKNKLEFIQAKSTSRYYYILAKLQKKIPWYYKLMPEKYDKKKKEAKRKAVTSTIKLSKYLIEKALRKVEGESYNARIPSIKSVIKSR